MIQGPFGEFCGADRTEIQLDGWQDDRLAELQPGEILACSVDYDIRTTEWQLALAERPTDGELFIGRLAIAHVDKEYPDVTHVKLYAGRAVMKLAHPGSFNFKGSDETRHSSVAICPPRNNVTKIKALVLPSRINGHQKVLDGVVGVNAFALQPDVQL